MAKKPNQTKPTHKITALLLGVMLLLLGAARVMALNSDRAEQMLLRADFVDINQKTRYGTYTHHVELDQGTTHLRADKAVTQMNNKNQLIKAIAYGNKQYQVHCWTTTDENKPPLHAHADKITYYPQQKVIELQGNARVEQGSSRFTAPLIKYNVTTQHIITQKVKQQRTTIIIHPEKRT